MELLKIVHKKAQNGLAYSQLNIEQVYMCAHTQKQPHTGCVIINAHHTWRVRKVECCYWTLNTFPPRSVCPSMRTEWNAPLLILSGCHSDENMGWEFGFEFSCCRNPMGQKHREGGRGRSRGNVCANDFEKLHVGLEGEKKRKTFWLKWIKGSRIGWDWITERERERGEKVCFYLNWDNSSDWVTDAGLFGFKYLNGFVSTGLWKSKTQWTHDQNNKCTKSNAIRPTVMMSWRKSPAHSDKHYISPQEWALNDPTGQVIDEQKLN